MAVDDSDDRANISAEREREVKSCRFRLATEPRGDDDDDADGSRTIGNEIKCDLLRCATKRKRSFSLILIVVVVVVVVVDGGHVALFFVAP